MTRTKRAAQRGRGRGRGRGKNVQPASPEKVEELRYMLANDVQVSLAKSPVARKSTVKGPASLGSKKGKRALSPMSKFSREVTAKLDGGSSEFESPVKGRRGRPRKVQVEQEEDEDEEEEQEDEEEEEVQEDEEEDEEEEDEEAIKDKKKKKKKNAKTTRPKTGRMGPEASINAAFRLNMAAKVQRLRNDPRFTGIKAETLERVVEQFEKDNVTPSVIINTTVCKPVARRTRVAWTDEEINDLHQGVIKHGSSWSKILSDDQFQFNARTQVDLKDKWRNLNTKRLYSELPIRRFILVNEHHEPAMTDKGYYHVFNNRWPADAAIKVATKDFIYPEGVDSVRVYLREIPAEGKEGAPVVHVFDVARKVELARNIPKFQGMGRVYVGEARKVCTERLLTRQAVIEDLRDATRMNFNQD